MHFDSWDRRYFLKSLGLMGGALPLSTLWADDPNVQLASAKAKSVIHIFLPGGLSAQESFDPKPFNTYEFRGPYSSIKTKVPGVHFSNYLQKTAKIADKITVIRSMTHGEAAHERGTHNMFTGYRPSPAVKYASIGSVISQQLGDRNNMPSYIAIPNQANNFAGSGFLSSTYSPFSLGSDPANSNFKVKDLELHKGLKPERFEKRRSMLKAMDENFAKSNDADLIKAMDSFYQRAYQLMESKTAREAFDIRKEKKQVRDRYGMHQAGQRLLMARRLVEAGSRYVSLTVGGWDHHVNIRDGIKKELAPLDQAYAALISDLEQRGLLKSTLVILNSEFGRTPKINKDGGRDHYPKVFSMALAGGGVKQGLVYGASDSTSNEVEENPVSVADYARTLYSLMGIDPEARLMAPGDRPVALVKGGRVLKELLV